MNYESENVCTTNKNRIDFLDERKVVVGLSGGVDSSVCALLLLEQGYTVVGVTIVMCEYNDSGVSDAREVAKALNIEHHVIDSRTEFDKDIMDYFCKEYLAGRTPNPCIRCNELIKWAMMLRFADSIGAKYIATGHYAGVSQLANGRYIVTNSVTATKDQTYVLYRLSQDMLQRTLMPLGKYDKDTVRRIAEESKIPVAAKKDSQDICFIPDKDYAAFLEKRLQKSELPGRGNFIDENGNVIGTHKGYTHYTIGQRKGLEIAAGHRVFVKEIRPETNEVVISDEDIYQNSLKGEDIHFMSKTIEDFSEGISCRGFVKIRYAHKGEWCNFEIKKNEISGQNELMVVFEKPVRAVTPGQAVVIYDTDKTDRCVILGATITD